MDSNSGGTMKPSDRYSSVVGSIHHILDQPLPRHVNRELREAPPLTLEEHLEQLKQIRLTFSTILAPINGVKDPPESAFSNRRNSAFTSAAFSRHHSLWFEDGNIVLIAQGIGFRVYRGILKRYSEVFRDMFEAAHPSESVQDMIDGVPSIDLSDAAKDISCFLDALFLSGTKFFRKDVPIPVETVMAMFRMGTKYEVPHIRVEALRRLESHLLSRIQLFLLNSAYAYLKTDGFIGWPISIVNLARSFNLPHLLPGAFYLCSQLPLSTLVHGFQGAYGSIEKLSAEDLTVCLEGRDRLITRNVAAAISLSLCSPQGPGSSCPCGHVLRHFYSDSKFADPSTVYLLSATPSNLCKLCSTIWRRKIVDTSETTWKELGTYFQVQPWPVGHSTFMNVTTSTA